MKDYTADLHIHTVLSPCASVEMIPPLIVREAQRRGIDLIAITDHNASANVEAVIKAAADKLVVLPGMELQTHEEVHLLCLFDTVAQLAAWQAVVNTCLPAQENIPAILGEQFIVSADGDLIGYETRLLATSARISFEEAVEEVRRLGGLAIPAHVTRQVYSLFAVLGFVPPGTAVDALEISASITPDEARRRFPQLADFPLVQNSDAHCLDDLLGSTVLTLAAPTIAEMRLALQGREGRGCRIVASGSRQLLR
ncbi:MAG: PHP domain-containing protein [Anaerolineae bacterium]|nr:PHP domain-containing protein [Anaerolineae bacterium]